VEKEEREIDIEDTVAWLHRMQSELRGAGAEAAGSPSAGEEVAVRLRLEKVEISLAPGELKATVALHDGQETYLGRQRARKGEPLWAVAAAAVEALNSYLESRHSKTPPGRIQLLGAESLRFGPRETAICALVELAEGRKKQRFLGAVLTKEWGAASGAAAVLDALNRKTGRRPGGA